MPVYASAKVAKQQVTNKNIVGVRITADSPPMKPTKLGVAIDTSGSMSGSRIDSVKQCLKVLINRLRVGDCISVVGFADTASMILSNYTISADNRDQALTNIDSLSADGGTNAESAITALGALYQNDKPDAVLFLTDGHINQGISSGSGLLTLIKSYLTGVPFFTLGYGEGHNADLLRKLALRTKATYTFAEDEMVLPASMGELLASLQYEVAKGLLFNIPNGWTCMEPNFENTDSKYEFGSIIADKSTWALFAMDDAAVAAATNVSITATVDGHAIPITFDDSIDSMLVTEQEFRCVVGKAMDSVATFLEQSNVAAAKTMLTDTIAHLKYDTVAASRPLVIRMIAQVEDMLEMCNSSTYSTPPRRGRSPNMHSPPALAFRSRGMGANYSTQRGGSGGGTTEYLFSTPTLINATVQMVADYSSPGRANDPSEQSSV